MRKKRYGEIVRDLKRIKKRGYIRTHRSGNTGVGKTLEDLLGIQENNISGPNSYQTELKSRRSDSNAMLTLFTKSLMPKGINKVMIQKFGYGSRNKKTLHSVVNAVTRNTIHGRKGFKLNIIGSRINISCSGIETPHWDKIDLRNAFNRKYPKNLLYVKADSRGHNTREEFHYNEAWLMSGFNSKRFIRLLKEGQIYVEIRIGMNQDGTLHDHNPAFRIPLSRFELLFMEKKKVL